MTRKRLIRPERSGRTAVEAAIVINLVLVLVLSVFEYGRLIMIKQLMDNAAREGARYAVVNTNPTSNVTTSTIQSYTTGFLAGQPLANSNIQVYQANPTTGANVGAWNSAAFGVDIAVQIDGDYTPVLPVTFGVMPAALHLTAKSVMRSEAN